MSDATTPIRDCERLLELLSRDDCRYCGGRLETGAYKDTDAVLCRDCRSPVIRVW